MKKILVTGAGGLVGYDVAKLLDVNPKYEVFSTVHRKNIDGLKNIIQIDLQKNSVESLKVNFDYIVHCAAIIPDGVHSDEQVAYVNRCIDDNIIAYCVKHKCRLIFVSTAAVYGYESNILLTEQTTLNIDTGYKSEKRNSEIKIEDECASYCILRISSPYGPRQEIMAVMKRFIEAVYCREKLYYFGSGARTQNFIDVRDIARAVLKSIEGNENGIFNIASKNAISMKELANLVVKIGKEEFFTDSEVCAGNNIDPQENVRVNIDIRLAEELIGWTPQIELDDGIRHWMKSMKRNGREEYNVGEIPFYYVALTTPSNPIDLPNKLCFMLMQGEDGLIRQVPNEMVQSYLNLAYQKGSEITGLMDDNGIGKRYADDFIQYICKNEKNIANRKILEIGCGTGYLLYELKKLGAEVLGVEPGEHGIEGSKKYGVPVINSFFNPSEITEKYDIVVFYAVLEHMQDAGGFLRDIKSVLSKNGKIILAVPDCEPYIQAGDISLLVHEHWNYFTKDTLEALAANNGLSGNVVRSEFAGALYAFFDEVGDNKIVLASERDTLSAYIDKVERSKEKIFNYIESVMQSQSFGIYVPGRIINFLSICYEKVPKQIRFFDDNANLYGKYFPGIDIGIENFEDFVRNPVDVMIVTSFTFGSTIKEKILKSGIECKIVLLEELFR